MKPVKLSDGTTTLEERGYTVWHGWSDELAQELVTASRDPIIKQFTPGDTASRFSDPAAAQRWYETKKPAVYALLRENNLAGVVWFSFNQRPELDCDYTFAVRLYGAARGKGLAQPFATIAEADFRARQRPAGIWLETDTHNTAAHKLYISLGYHVVAATHGRTTMRKR